MPVLLSIKPEFVDKIIIKEKLYEFRKKVLKIPLPEFALIYSSNPVKSIIGFMTINEKLEDSPKNVWEKTSKYAGISEDFFYDYFETKSKAFALSISDVFEFSNHLTLDEIRSIIPTWNPPQDSSYLYGAFSTDLLLLMAHKNPNWKNKQFGELWRHSKYFTNRISDKPSISLQVFRIESPLVILDIEKSLEKISFTEDSSIGFFTAFSTRMDKSNALSCPFMIRNSRKNGKTPLNQFSGYQGMNTYLFDVLFDFQLKMLFIFSRSRYHISRVIQVLKKEGIILKKEKIKQSNFRVLLQNCKRIYDTRFKLKNTILDKYISIESDYTIKDEDYLTYRKRGNIIETEINMKFSEVRTRIRYTSDGGLIIKRNDYFPRSIKHIIEFNRFIFELIEGK